MVQVRIEIVHGELDMIVLYHTRILYRTRIHTRTVQFCIPYAYNDVLRADSMSRLLECI